MSGKFFLLCFLTLFASFFPEESLGYLVFAFGEIGMYVEEAFLISVRLS